MTAFRGSFLYLVLLLLLFSHSHILPQNQIPFTVISSGGGYQANSSFTLISTVGQAIINKSENTNHQALTGFWQMYLQNVLLEIRDQNMLPSEFKLEQNYPNPFNPSTIIKFGIPERSNVQIKIYDLLGSEVTTLLDQELDKGWYDLTFNASRFSSGFYIYRMQVGNYISTKKMLIIK